MQEQICVFILLLLYIKLSSGFPWALVLRYYALRLNLIRGCLYVFEFVGVHTDGAEDGRKIDRSKCVRCRKGYCHNRHPLSSVQPNRVPSTPLCAPYAAVKASTVERLRDYSPMVCKAGLIDKNKRITDQAFSAVMPLPGILAKIRKGGKGTCKSPVGGL